MRASVMFKDIFITPSIVTMEVRSLLGQQKKVFRVSYDAFNTFLYVQS